MTKELLDGYVGIKFDALCTDARMPPACEELYPLFRACGDRLWEHGMTPKNGGNLSQRLPSQGIAITTSGCNLGSIDPEELALVQACSLEQGWVTYAGPRPPSSEAMLHWLIYREFYAAGAVVHAHDELATSGEAVAGLPETPREEPYGTVALARLAARTYAGGGEIIVLKNHGYLATGTDLEVATEVVVRMHLKLMGLRAGD